MAKRAVVYIGLGSNIGRRTANIRKALVAIARLPSYRITAVSPLYRTSPVGPDQRDFVNAVARLATSRLPDEVLRDLKGIEQELGRTRTTRWGPRVIDLDILFYGARVLYTRTLTVPHPGIAGRRFVLEPLAAIAPALRHPVLRRTVRKLRNEARLTQKDQKVTMMSNRRITKEIHGH